MNIKKVILKLKASMLAIATLAMLILSCNEEETKPEVELPSLKVTPATLTLIVGETGKVATNIAPVEWSSNATDKVTVDASTGVVTALADGSAKVTARYSDGQTASCDVTVAHIPATDFTLAPAIVEIFTDSALQITATPTPDNATAFKPVWSSSDESVATVSQTGLITGVSEGTAIITATLDAISRTVLVTVEPYGLAKNFTLTPTNTEIRIDDEVQITATLVPSNATVFDPVWTSSNPSVVSVTQTGLITALDYGTATVYATFRGIVKSVVIRVVGTVVKYEDKSQWSVHSYTGGYHETMTPARVIDGNPNTEWHTTAYSGVNFPYEIIINFGAELQFNGIVFHNRQEEGTDENFPKKVKWEAGNDPSNPNSWTTILELDEMSKTREELLLPCSSTVSAQYLKLTIYNGWRNDLPFTYIGEIGVYAFTR